MRVFIGQHENKIDKKGRVSVPAPYRPLLSSDSYTGMVAFRSLKDECIEGCTSERIEQLAERLEDFGMYDEEGDDLTLATLADAQQLSFDPEGRILLPAMLREHAGLTDKALFVGRGKTFQIWEPTRFHSRYQLARERARRANSKVPMAGGPKAGVRKDGDT